MKRAKSKGYTFHRHDLNMLLQRLGNFLTFLNNTCKKQQMKHRINMGVLTNLPEKKTKKNFFKTAQLLENK